MPLPSPTSVVLAPFAGLALLPDLQGRSVGGQPLDELSQCRGGPTPGKCALPEDGDPPTHAFELAALSAISFDIQAELLLPEFCTRGRRGRLRAAGMPVPVTPVDQTHCRVFPQHEVRATRQRSDVEPVTETRGVESPTDRHFRDGVLSPDSRHHP